MNTSKAFRIKTLRDHFKSVIWDRERALLPESQDAAIAKINEKRIKAFDEFANTAKDNDIFVDTQMIRAIKYRRSLIDLKQRANAHSPAETLYKLLAAEAYSIWRLIYFLQTCTIDKRFTQISLADFNPEEVFASIDQQQLEEEIKQLVEQRANFNAFFVGEKPSEQLFQDLFHESSSTSSLRKVSETNAVKSSRYNRPCPQSECRGFCDSRGICQLCSAKICTLCWAQLPTSSASSSSSSSSSEQDEHICKDEDVQSRRMILADSKPCPSCQTLIHRTHGCNHMFCTHCKTGFDWKTGNKIANNDNTNPMVGEYLRQRNIDVTAGCGGTLGDQALSECRKHVRSGKGTNEFSMSRLENVVTVLRANMRNLRVIDVNQVNHDLRVKYLLRETDEANFKKQSLTAVRASKVANDMRQLYDMFFAGVLQLLHSTKQSVVTIQDQYEHLRNYFNDCLRSICECHLDNVTNVTYTDNFIHPNWTMYGHATS